MPVARLESEPNTLSKLAWVGQRMQAVISSSDLIWEWDHGGPIADCGGRRAKAAADGSEPLAGPRRGRPGAGDLADPVGLDQPLDRRGLRGPRGYGSVLA